MSEKLSVKETKEVLDLALAMVDVGVSSMKDGKIGFEDLGQLMKLAPAVAPAIADIGKVPSELSDLSAEEGAELVAHVAAKLVIDDAKAKVVIEKSLKAVIAAWELVSAIKSAPAA